MTTRHNTCPECGHYLWAHEDGGCPVLVWSEKGSHECACKVLAPSDSSRSGLGSNILRDRKGLAACVLLGTMRIYHFLRDFVVDFFELVSEGCER